VSLCVIRGNVIAAIHQHVLHTASDSGKKRKEATRRNRRSVRGLSETPTTNRGRITEILV
jgi:hypothetical protein